MLVQPSSSPLPDSFMLTGNKQEEVGKQRRKYTKEEIFAAARVHECHTLCLISRGHMLDVAASDPLVQVLGRSAFRSFPASDKLLHSLALSFGVKISK